MKILILDRNLDDESGLVQRLALYQRPLSRKGHTVKAVQTLADLTEQGDALDNYQLAIVHPTIEDIRIIDEEIKQRKEFKVILHSVDPTQYPELYQQDSEQVWAYFTLQPQKLIKFIEEKFNW